MHLYVMVWAKETEIHKEKAHRPWILLNWMSYSEMTDKSPWLQQGSPSSRPVAEEYDSRQWCWATLSVMKRRILRHMHCYSYEKTRHKLYTFISYSISAIISILSFSLKKYLTRVLQSAKLCYNSHSLPRLLAQPLGRQHSLRNWLPITQT